MSEMEGYFCWDCGKFLSAIGYHNSDHTLTKAIMLTDIELKNYRLRGKEENSTRGRTDEGEPVTLKTVLEGNNLLRGKEDGEDHE